MNLINKLKGWIKSLFPIKTIKNTLNLDVAMSQDMITKIAEWSDMYSGRAYWLNKKVKSLRLEQSIVREFSNITLNEMETSVSNDKLDAIFHSAIRDINANLQEGLATGAMVIKPLGADKVQYVPQNEFIPLEYDNRGRLIKVIFPDFKQLSDSDYYTRLEIHSLDYEKGLTIENKAYYSKDKNSLGREVPLESVDEWAGLDRIVTYPQMLRPAFGYYRNPINNNIDGTHAGISMFECAIETIRNADEQYGYLKWEFESGKRKVMVSELALKRDEFGNVQVPNDDLFIQLDSDSDDFYKEFSPQFRQSDIISGLNEYKRNIEFQVGLAYGDISDPQSIEKTATEVKSAKQRKYNTVSAIQQNLKDCLEDLCYALAFYNSLATSNYEFVCNFKDSILTDEATERQQDYQDVSAGLMQPWEYRAKWYGESEDEAKKKLADSVTNIVE